MPQGWLVLLGLWLGQGQGALVHQEGDAEPMAQVGLAAWPRRWAWNCLPESLLEPVPMETLKELQLTKELAELGEPGGLSLEFHFGG